MRLSVILNCVSQFGGSNIKHKIERLQKFQKLLEEYPSPDHYRGIKDLDLQWIIGFYQGDGCISSYLKRNKESKLGAYIQNSFQLNQSNKSYYMMKDISCYYPLVGENNYLIYQLNFNYNIIQINSYQQLCSTFIHLEGQLVGDKWFSFVISKYVCQLLKRGYGKDSQRMLTLARYIVQNQKEYHNDTSKTSKRYTRVQERTQNQKDILYEMEQQAKLRGIPVPEVNYNEIILHSCYQPNSSLDERFILGFIEAEGCFHINIELKTTKFPLISPRLVFFLPQKGLKNKFILQDIMDKLGGKGRLKQCGEESEDSTYYLSISDQQQIKEYVVPFFQRNIPLTSKYYDFAKFTEICWGNHVGKQKCKNWMEFTVRTVYSMNNTVKQQSIRNHSIQQYLFYLGLANDQRDVDQKKRNLKVFRVLVFDWIKKWKYLNSGTKKQQKSAKDWFKNLQTKDLQLYLDDFIECSSQAVKVLNFVVSQVSYFEKTDAELEDVDYLWFYRFSQTGGSVARMKCRPFKMIIDQIELDSKNHL